MILLYYRFLKISCLVTVVTLGAAACAPQQALQRDGASVSDNLPKKVMADADAENTASGSYWLEQPTVIPWSEQSRTTQGQQLFDWMVGELTAYEGDLAVGLGQLSKLAIELNQVAAYQRVANIAFFAKDNRVMYDMVSRWLAIEPNSEAAHRMALSLEVERAQLSIPNARQSAYAHIQWLLENSEAPLSQRFLDITASLGQHKNDAFSLGLMEQVLDAYPGNADAYAAYANLAVIYNKKDRALAALQQALELNPKQTNAIILQSQLIYRQGDTATAIKQLGRAVKQDKQSRVLRSSYARMLMNSKEYKKARYQYEYLLEDTPSDTSLLLTLGLLALDNEDFARAEEYFDRLQTASPQQDEANFYLGRTAEAQEKYADAVFYYLSVYGGNYYTESRFRAVWSYADLEQYELAKKILVNLREQKDPAINLRSYLSEGLLLRRQKRYDDAFEIYTRALQNNPQNDDLLYARAIVAEKIDKIDIVERDLRDILKRQPDNADVLNTLGYTLANVTQRYDDAYVLIKRALQIQPESGAIIDSYGWVLYRKGQYKEALIYLRKAYEKESDPEIAAHLGEVLWVTGDKEAAEQIWNNALKDVPDNETVLNTINRLKTP